MSDDLRLFVGDLPGVNDEKKDEAPRKKKKIKVSLTLGSIVEVYSSSSAAWLDARVDKIKGDKLCVVYLDTNAMKWLKKTSRQLRLKPEHEQQARDITMMAPPEGFDRKLRLSFAGLESKKRASAMLPSFIPPPPSGSAPPPSIHHEDSDQPAPPDEPPPRRRNSYQPMATTPPPPTGPPPKAMSSARLDVTGRTLSFPPPLERSRSLSSPERGRRGDLVKQHSSPQLINRATENEEKSESVSMGREMTLQWSPEPPQQNFTNVGLFRPGAVTHDYDVEFEEPMLGITINPLTPDGLNAIVTSCVLPYAKRNVNVNSRLVAINGRNMIGAPYDTIKQMLREATRNPPIVVTFRSEHERVLRGTLKIKVVGALHLRPLGSYATVQVNKAQLATKTVPPNEHPEWNESFTFKNYRPEAGKMAKAAVWRHNRLLKDSVVGEAEFALPTAFDDVERVSLELYNKKGNLSGVLTISCAILTPGKRDLR